MTKRVTYCCPFVPAEWIAAHGLRPCRIAPRAQSAAAPPDGAQLGRQGVCAYARNFTQAIAEYSPDEASPLDELIVFTTTCDQMRRSWERVPSTLAESSLLLHIPATWKTPTSHYYYGEELKRLGRFLVRHGGESPKSGQLGVVMQQYDAKRRLLSATREALSSRGFAEALDHFQRTGDLQLAPREGAAQDGVRLALVGSPLHAEHFALMDFLEENGARVALDATGSGERALPAEFDPQRLAADPFAELVNAYFGRLPSAFRRPNEQLYDWLGQKLAERRVQGIIFLHYAWCDTWQAEAQRMKEWTETPLLVIGGIDDELMTSHASGRIQAFLEMLK